MTEIVVSPVAGRGKPLEELNDEMFASRMLGDGFAVRPQELFAKKEVVSPIDGRVTMVYETGHAIGIVSEQGNEILIHIGIDTVMLKGKPFDTRVKVGDWVKKGDLLCLADWKLIRKNGCDTDVIVIALNHKIEVLADVAKVERLAPLYEIQF